MTDAVALRLYLSEAGAAIDGALRTGANGPHVPLARCVVSSLTRLPSHRGATVFRASPTPEQWQLYQTHRHVTSWAFTSALAAPCSAQDGEADVLVWAMTARRTKLFEPAGDDRVTDRLLFVPGTSFKVLAVSEPGGGSVRPQILLRELSAAEIDADGHVDPGRASLDDIARASLSRCAEQWADAPAQRRVGDRALCRFGELPGLVDEEQP
jgi:hypothetical protein